LRQISATQYVGRFSSTKHKVAGQVTVTLKGSSVQTVTFDSNRGQASVTLKKL
jgi:hypothetical protein